jgi:hypothetical protein
MNWPLARHALGYTILVVLGTIFAAAAIEDLGWGIFIVVGTCFLLWLGVMLVGS